MTFRFDAVRNFSSVSFHANNQRSRDVRVFRAARLTFSGGVDAASGGGRRSRTVNYSYVRDDVMEYARVIPVALHHHVGDHVTVRLYFDDRWIMISEVQFQSGTPDTQHTHHTVHYNTMEEVICAPSYRVTR